MNRNQLYTAICKTLISGRISVDNWWFNRDDSKFHINLGNPKNPKGCIYLSYNKDNSYNLHLDTNLPLNQYHYRIRKYV